MIRHSHVHVRLLIPSMVTNTNMQGCRLIAHTCMSLGIASHHILRTHADVRLAFALSGIFVCAEGCESNGMSAVDAHGSDQVPSDNSTRGEACYFSDILLWFASSGPFTALNRPRRDKFLHRIACSPTTPCTSQRPLIDQGHRFSSVPCF